jgi:hypothetical protein
MAEMTKKAQIFQDFLKEKKIEAFEVETLPDDPEQTTAFRSHVEVDGQRLPMLVLLDHSVFSMIRVQISPRCRTADNEKAVLELANEQNFKYKPFKLYFDKEGSLILDICLLTPDEDSKELGNMLYAMFDVMIGYLNENYRALMKAIW